MLCIAVRICSDKYVNLYVCGYWYNCEGIAIVAFIFNTPGENAEFVLRSLDSL